ncbi:MAG: NUDIX domain-containing protein [Alphaproteobacteria bacterium]|nr:MAG: NUDIX domain-containing protein [Alphaproteobacteria bacterium]
MRYHINPHLILEKENKVLLLHRTNTGVCDNLWCTPTGAIESGENPSQAIIREGAEEIGIHVQKLESVCSVFHKIHDYFDPTQPHYGMCIFFNVQEYSGDPCNKESHKHGDMQWFSLDQLPENILPVAKHGLNCFKEGVQYTEFDNFEG